MLPTVTRIRDLLTPYYWIALVINIILTFGINFAISRSIIIKYPEKNVIFDLGVIINVIVTIIVVGLVVFCGTAGIRSRIVKGKAHPIAQTSLCDTFIKRTVFFSMAVPNWRSRLFRFIANCMVINAPVVILTLLFACWADLGFPPLNSTAKCTLSHWSMYSSIDAAWKSLMIIGMYTINFISAHNDAQPELYKEDILFTEIK
eukprot:Tbor_TRINITY_DN4332_c0_g1::TRINITY_DN4332_c0_g1_i1::g.7805::m.7805